MSDTECPTPAPLSPVDGDETITLTEEQIQHVFSICVVLIVENHTNSIWEKHGGI